MSPELAAIATLWGLVLNGGPWFIVMCLALGFVWALNTNRIYLAREHDALAAAAVVAAEKAVRRETELVGEVNFWRERYLNENEMSRTAMGAVGALSTTNQRGQR